MSGGRIEQVGLPRVIFEKPANRFVADFMGFANLRSAVVDASDRTRLLSSSEGLELRADVDGFRPASGNHVGVGIRRERIAIRRSNRNVAGQCNAVTGVHRERDLSRKHVELPRRHAGRGNAGRTPAR